jgi:4-alpha-glucanotransferase
VNEHDDLRELARLSGVQTSYHDVWGQEVQAGPEALLGILRALGAPLEGVGDASDALAALREERAGLLAEPVAVAWDGHLPSLLLRPATGGGPLACHLDLEGGGRRACTADLGSLPQAPPAEGSDRPGRLLDLTRELGGPLPLGYHRLRLEAGGRTAETLILAAPGRAFSGDGRPLWGVFLPLYALRTERSWGVGDFSDLEALAAWTAGLGGGVVATLPMLAAFLDEPFEPSPYAPASRLFWNETYVDPRALPEFEGCEEARRLVESRDFRQELEALRREPLVDWARLAGLKRRVLEELAHGSAQHPAGREELQRFVEAKPHLEDYAAFRAVLERRGEPWQLWPERLREGNLAAADWDEDDRRYHLWAQWAADRQLRGLAAEARRHGPGLYLDLPLGVHGSSYDVWRWRDLFAEGAAAGAPPDTFFTRGQNWGFPPLKPERLRERGYDHWIDTLRHHLEHAGLLRIDHVMQLQRLFWVPEGMDASAGAYVRYPAEELFAVLCLESHRNRALLVGENLGTVPPEMNESMERHDVLGMFVVQYELQPNHQGMRTPPPATAASLNTHDMPPFRSYWEGRDVDDLQDLGFFTAQQAREERERRAALRQAAGASADDALRRYQEELAAGPARIALINLEDLWGEDRPQNVPGTHDERPNWRRKARYDFEEFSSRPEVVDLLRRVDRLRNARGGTS